MGLKHPKPRNGCRSPRPQCGQHSSKSDPAEGRAFRALEIGEPKWYKEYIPHNGSDPITDEGQILLDDPGLLKDSDRKESDKCDLCKSLWIVDGRFITEDALPVQDLGHIQHTCESLSKTHTLTHHC